jgi:dihydrodipicolinate synthase/N-acetylneuraminate lyase
MGGIEQLRARLGSGLVIPACPLALNARRRLDERRQRALFRYYLAAGVGGLAVGVHTTQFAIRQPNVGLFKPVLEMAVEELRGSRRTDTIIGISGICGNTKQATAEAALARELGCHAGLLSLGALQDASNDELLAHCRTVAEIIPLIGFYLQPAAGGRVLPFGFWRSFAEIGNVVAIKIAPFNRYQTIEVIRAIAEAGREDIALYTGNDDNIVIDLLTPFRFNIGSRIVERRIVGGLLGHWAVWTKTAVELHAECRRTVMAAQSVPRELMQRAVEVTDANAAFFDAANLYAGCIPGIHEVLRRQGLLDGIWCLDPNETLSPGQVEEIGRVQRSYPHLNDDGFVAEHRDEWLNG